MRQEYVWCGKARCRCSNGGHPHGPYWYGYWWNGKRKKKFYIGKVLPRDNGARLHYAHQVRVNNPPGPVDRWSYEDPSGPTLLEAQKILGIRGPLTLAKAKKAKRRLGVRHHPDKARTQKARAKKVRIARAVNTAYDAVVERLAA